MKKFYFITLAFSLILTLPACKKSNDISNADRNFDTSLPSGQMVFSHLPVDTITIGYIMALGHIAPPGHTRPSDHMYFVNVPPGTVIYAPASGKVLDTFTFDEGNNYHDNRVTIGATNTATYYFMHIVLDADIKIGVTVKAGQRLGVVSKIGNGGFDMGAMVKTIDHPFLDPQLYGLSSLHCDSPIKHFTGDMQNELYAKVRRLGQDKDGKICYDISGKLSGNWIAENAKNFDPLKTDNYDSYFVAFVYGNYNPSKMVISIGNNSFFTSVNGSSSYNGTKVFYVQPGATKFEDVNVNGGKQVYELFKTGEFDGPTGMRVGILIVQMLSDKKIKVEFFDDTTSTEHDFTSNAKIYVR